jgi:hypothetical protein
MIASLRGLFPILAVAASLCGGCQTLRVARLREPGIFTVTPRAVPDAGRIVVQPFVDARGREYGRAFPSGSIPLVNFVHAGGRAEYPDQAGVFRNDKLRPATRVIGELGTEVPYLVARGLGPRVVVDDRVPAGREYVVSGAILQSTVTWHGSAVLGAIAILGVPMQFGRHQLRVRMVVHHRDRPEAPLLSRIYSFDRRRMRGIYYGIGFEQKLARAALRHVVDSATADIAVAIANDRTGSGRAERHRAQSHGGG